MEYWAGSKETDQTHRQNSHEHLPHYVTHIESIYASMNRLPVIPSDNIMLKRISMER